MNRVVADSNILISALLWGGKPLELLELARAGEIEVAVSDAILDETARVLKTNFNVPDEDVQEFRQELLGFCKHVVPTESLDVVPSDKTDSRIPAVGNAVWKKMRREEVTADEARRLVADLERVPVESIAMRTLLSDAVALAIEADVTVYDATYLTLAVRLDTEVITGDDRLARKVEARPGLRRYIRAVEDFVD